MVLSTTVLSTTILSTMVLYVCVCVTSAPPPIWRVLRPLPPYQRSKEPHTSILKFDQIFLRPQASGCSGPGRPSWTWRRLRCFYFYFKINWWLVWLVAGFVLKDIYLSISPPDYLIFRNFLALLLSVKPVILTPWTPRRRKVSKHTALANKKIT